MKTKNTPTPWYSTKTDKYIVIQSTKINEDNFVCSMPEPQKQDEINAKHIIKCVNSHDELVEALKICEKYFINKNNLNIDESEAYIYIKNALKNAESEAMQ